jgi:hypothetical protein
MLPRQVAHASIYVEPYRANKLSGGYRRTAQRAVVAT